MEREGWTDKDHWDVDLMHVASDYTVADCARAGHWADYLTLLTDLYGEV